MSPARGRQFIHGQCYRCGEPAPVYLWTYPKDVKQKHFLCPVCWDWLESEYRSEPGAYVRLTMQMLRQHDVWRRQGGNR